jgi:hypothetical protein
MIMAAVLASFILLAQDKAANPMPHLDDAMAAKFANLALSAIEKPYPYKPAHVLDSDADALLPRKLHPVFYGAYDWHSSVHGHWVLVRLLRLRPNLPQAPAMRAALSRQFTTEAMAGEVAFFSRKHTGPFERPYGWAWLLKLATELHAWDDPDAKKWSAIMGPLEEVIVNRYLNYFPKQTYPIRHGVHANTAFGLTFALDYARAKANKSLENLLLERANKYFANDTDAPARWEPDGSDFFSPSLCEADLMRRVLPPAEFTAWLHRFYPNLEKSQPKSILQPATVSDRTDPQIVHLDGLNISRAWCLEAIALALPEKDLARPVLLKAAAVHASEGIAHVTSGDYAGEHWLASFATHLMTWKIDR